MTLNFVNNHDNKTQVLANLFPRSKVSFNKLSCQLAIHRYRYHHHPLHDISYYSTFCAPPVIICNQGWHFQRFNEEPMDPDDHFSFPWFENASPEPMG